jgi:hypothetical protein
MKILIVEDCGESLLRALRDAGDMEVIELPNDAVLPLGQLAEMHGVQFLPPMPEIVGARRCVTREEAQRIFPKSSEDQRRLSAAREKRARKAEKLRSWHAAQKRP